MAVPLQLAFQNWTDYIAHSVLVDFTAATGITVSYQTYVSNDELAKRLILASAPRRGGRTGTTFDLVVPSENFVRRSLELGLLQPIDANTGSLSNIGNLAPQFRREGFDAGNRTTCSGEREFAQTQADRAGRALQRGGHLADRPAPPALEPDERVLERRPVGVGSVWVVLEDHRGVVAERRQNGARGVHVGVAADDHGVGDIEEF